MGEKTRYKVIDTAAAAAGALICIVSGSITAPEGMLPEGNTSIIQVLASGGRIWLFVLASLLLAASAVLAATGKLRAVSLIAALAGACMFALIDLSIVTNFRAFEGTILNEAGIVLAVSGALLHAVGTPKEKDSIKETQAEEEERHPDIEETELPDYTEDFYRSADEAAVSTVEKNDTEDFGEYLTAAIKAITEENDEALRETGGQDGSAEADDADFYASLEDMFRTQQ